MTDHRGLDMKVGFIGIGLMGKPMVRRLLAAGISVVIWNRSPEKVRALLDEGAQSTGSISDLVRAVDIVMLCLSDTEAVEDVVFAKDGIASLDCSGKILVDFSSIDPQKTKLFSQRLQDQAGMAWIDAPVSGGVSGAENGSLIIMAGGDAAHLDTIRPLLLHLSQRVTHMGAVGSGQMTKTCNQMIVACNAMVIAEMMALARAAGVDVKMLPKALSGGFADSIPFQILAPQMAEHDFTLKWKVNTLLKDLEGAAEQARNYKNSIPISAIVAQILRNHSRIGNGDKDLSTIISIYESID